MENDRVPPLEKDSKDDKVAPLGDDSENARVPPLGQDSAPPAFKISAPPLEEDSATSTSNAPASRIGMDKSCFDFTSEEWNTMDLEPDGSVSGSIESEDGLAEEIKKVEPLRPEEVRWFYLKNETKGTRLKPMCGNDSLRLENAYGKYIAGFKNVKKVSVRGGMFEVDLQKKACFPIYWQNTTKEEEQGDPVLRGTWFYSNWFPLSWENSKRIEKEHQERWKDYDMTLIKELVKTDVMHSVQLKETYVEWKSVNKVFLYKDTTVSRAVRTVNKRVGISKASRSYQSVKGYQIHRGYNELAEMSDQMPPIGNLMLVIHGIGSVSDRFRVIRNTTDFRRLCRKFETELDSKARTLYLPIEWRSDLKLNEKQVRSITPYKSVAIRRFLHTTALDVMYYSSHTYRTELVYSLKKELNRVYAMFIERNPTFTGNVNVFCHSLGCAIFHDIVTNWHPNEEDSIRESIREHSLEKSSSSTSSKKTQKSTSKRKVMSKLFPKFSPQTHVASDTHKPSVVNDDDLIFRTHSMFCIGSPLGIFLHLRGIEPGGTLDRIIPPPCKFLYNIYHPADPVAYRLEPLLYEHYSLVKPVVVELYEKQQPIKRTRRLGRVTSDTGLVVKEREELVNARGGTSLTDESSRDLSDSSGKQSILRAKIAKSIGKSIAGPVVRLGSRLMTSDDNFEADQRVYEAVLPHIDEKDLDPRKQAILRTRMDYVLPEGGPDSKFGYAALTSHTSYWRNPDLARFITSLLQKTEDELMRNTARFAMDEGSVTTDSVSLVPEPGIASDATGVTS